MQGRRPHLWTILALSVVLSGPADVRGVEALATPSVTYVHKIPDITDFTGYGEYGYYFPRFGRSVYDDEKKTDSGMVFHNPLSFKWEFDIRDDDRTFSPDAGFFGDCCSLRRVGVYTAGGDTSWDYFVLPNGQEGYAGTTVDEHARNNTNQSINRIGIHADTPGSFCLRILQDSTNGRFDSDGRLTARARAGGADYEADVLPSDHTYDGSTDMYVFRYENLQAGDFIKIKFKGIDKDPGFSGILFDPVETCPNPPIVMLGLAAGQGTEQLPEGAATTLPLAANSAAVVATGDFDGNGISDYVFSWVAPTASGDRQSIYLNGHTWVGLHDLPARSYAVGDLDGDGRDDIAIDFGWPHPLSAHMNLSYWSTLRPERADVIEMVDLDGNATQELVANFPDASPPLKIYWNGASWSDFHAQAPTNLDAGQINGSGVEELVASFADGLWVYEDAASWRRIHAVPPAMTEVVDLNGNGLADVVATWPDAACDGAPCGLQVAYDGAGEDGWTLIDPRTPNAFAGGDIDGNSKGDLVVSWSDGSPILKYMNDESWVPTTDDGVLASAVAVRAFTCGDYICRGDETSCDCPSDCAVAAGDDCCDVGEVSCSEPACPVVQGDGCCDYARTEVCDSPDCICPEVTMGAWAGFSPVLYDHPAPPGLNRLLVFVAHGVRNDRMHVDHVRYGDQRMTKVLQQQEHHHRRALVSIFILGEEGIANAERLGRSDFFVDWNGQPFWTRRRYESVFFFNVDRIEPVVPSSNGHTDGRSIQTALGLVEAGHMSMYATTHEECVDWFPLGDYLEIYQACGERSSAVSVGYRHGRAPPPARVTPSWWALSRSTATGASRSRCRSRRSGYCSRVEC
jgi:hypothetical protein